MVLNTMHWLDHPERIPVLHEKQEWISTQKGDKTESPVKDAKQVLQKNILDNKLQTSAPDWHSE